MTQEVDIMIVVFVVSVCIGKHCKSLVSLTLKSFILKLMVPKTHTTKKTSTSNLESDTKKYYIRLLSIA